MPLYLAIDQGGHASRALVFDADGNVVAQAMVEIGDTRPTPDRVEQDADALLVSVRAAVDGALTQLGTRACEVVAAGLATQRSSVVCWDRLDGHALSPVLSWQDRRAAAALAPLTAHAGAIRAKTGLVVSPHYGASKLRWCLDHLPAVQAAARAQRLACGPLASFLLFRLLEERPFAVDPANAARTLLWNHRARDWDDELLALFGVPPAVLPASVPTRHAFGHLSVAGHRLPLTVCTGDQSAALFGLGEPPVDRAYVNLGTGAFVQRALAGRPAVDAGLLVGIVYQDERELRYAQEGTVNGAGSALQWISGELGMPDAQRRLHDWLASEHEPPLFLNGISGLGAPFWRADFRSRFIGAGAPAAPAAQVVAVAESIVFLLMTNLEAMQRSAPLVQLVVTGGLAREDGLLQRLADLSGLAAERPAEPEATARGLAYLVAGRPPAWRSMSTGARFWPSANAALAGRYRRWRAALSAALADAAP
jgi:glycerol kinase